MASNMTTNSSKLALPSTSNSSMTTVDISLTPLPSTTCASKNQYSRKSSKFQTGGRSAANVNCNDTEIKPQDNISLTTAVEMAHNSSQFVPNQPNSIPIDECFGPKPPPIPVNITILVFSGSMIFWYLLYIRNNQSKDNNWIILIEKVMLQVFEVFTRYTRYCFPLYCIKRKEETKNFAVDKIKSFLLRYLTQDKTEKIVRFIENIE